MDTAIRPYAPEDRDAVVALALNAWEPVHASPARVLGPEFHRVLAQGCSWCFRPVTRRGRDRLGVTADGADTHRWSDQPDRVFGSDGVA